MSKSSNRKRRARKAARPARHTLAAGQLGSMPSRDQEHHPDEMSLSALLSHRPGWVLSQEFLEITGAELWCFEPSRPHAGVFAPDPSATAVSWTTGDPQDGLLVEPPSVNGSASRHERIYKTPRELSLDIAAIEGWRAEVTGPPPGAQYGAPSGAFG